MTITLAAPYGQAFLVCPLTHTQITVPGNQYNILSIAYKICAKLPTNLVGCSSVQRNNKQIVKATP